MSKRNNPDSNLKNKINLVKTKLAQNSVVNLSEYRNALKNENLKRILFVDADIQFLNQMRKIFLPHLYHVYTAKDAMEVTKIMEETHLDAVVINADLPWMDGYELCTLLKSIPFLKNLPIALISCHKTEEDRRRGRESGCDDFLGMPFIENDLIQTVSNLL
jgi:DNA-binding response OmpR family regulator